MYWKVTGGPKEVVPRELCAGVGWGEPDDTAAGSVRASSTITSSCDCARLTEISSGSACIRVPIRIRTRSFSSSSRSAEQSYGCCRLLSCAVVVAILSLQRERETHNQSCRAGILRRASHTPQNGISAVIYVTVIGLRPLPAPAARQIYLSRSPPRRVLATSTSSRGSLNMKSLSFVPCISSCWGRWVHTRSRLSRCTSKKHVSHRASPGPNTLQVTGARRHDTSTLTVSSEAGRTRL